MNELGSIVESLKPSEPTQAKSWIHTIPHEWLRLEEHEGNCDQLPSRLTPKTGCPKCGAAWLSVEQVAFSSVCYRGSLATGQLDVLQVGQIEPPMAVRLKCSGGHLVEYDGRLLTVIELPSWSMLTLGIAGLAAMGLFGRALAARGPK
jgi:hypothetical protein